MRSCATVLSKAVNNFRSVILLALATTQIGAATLTWNRNPESDIAGYRVFHREVGATFQNVDVRNTNSFSTTLASGRSYEFYVTAYNTAGLESSPSQTLAYTAPVQNTPPTISTIANQTISEDGTAGPISFVLNDAESGPSALTLSAASANTILVPTTGLTLAGTGTNRTITVKPAANKFGSATISLSASDGTNTTVRSFTVTVNSVNDLPTITNLRNRTIPPNYPLGPLAFTVKDVETSAGNLQVDSWSSNQAIVPDSNLSLSGTGANRTLTLTPAPNATGTTTITVEVFDGTSVRTDTFTLNVQPGAPTLLLNEGFEATGYDNGGWVELGNPNQDYTNIRLADTQSIRATGGNQFYRVFTNAQSLHLYTQVRWTSFNTNHAAIGLISAQNTASGFLSVGTDRTLQLLHGSASSARSTALSANITYHLWLDWTAATSQAGTMALYLSTTATKPTTPTLTLNSGNGVAYERLYFGTPTTGPVMLFDNICLDDVPLGSNPAY
ncbi:MAG TPA: fibronectin type III domain-containing protein [Verrucomicrobiae bacterium]